ncbi:MAG: alcohol dehydrogenase [Candidatus Hydrogenedentota bacterium]
MKALVLEDYGHLVYRDVAEPELGPYDVLVAIRACGVCGSDIHGMDGRTGRRRPPIIMGHEASGVVAGVGASVENWKLGDRVTFDSTVYCGECHYCRAGQVNLCDRRRVLGVSCEDYRMNGAFADFVAVPERILYRLPDSLSFETAAFVEPVSIALHAVKRSGAREGGEALVYGTGMIGLLVVQALRLAGVRRIVAIDNVQSKLDLARTMGASQTVHACLENRAKALFDVLKDGPVDYAFDVVGTSETLAGSIQAVRKGGTVTLIGNLSPAVEVPLQTVVTREITLLGSCACNGEYLESLRLLERGDVSVEGLLSAVAPLADGAQWFYRLYQGEPGLMKVLLRP